VIGSDDFLGQSFIMPYVKGKPRIVYFQGDCQFIEVWPEFFVEEVIVARLRI
jgi:hypothetical protein